MIMKKRFIFWSLFIVLSLLGTVYAWLNFTNAFPVVDIRVETDREQSVIIARQIAESHGFSVSDMRTAVHFDLDREVQYFTELEAGGKTAFRDMLQDSLYEPYSWVVRFFKERQEEEFLVRLTPDGRIFGFYHKIPENAPGPVLSESEALSLIYETAAMYKIPLNTFQDAEISSEKKPGGRIDHVFVFERTDVRLGEEGRYRLRFTVSGNIVTQMKHYIDVPEGFHLRYENMRAANRTIANLGLVAMFVFLGVGGLAGLYYLLKQHAVKWKPALLWGCGIALIQVAALFNQWPLIWMNYDTALSKSGFIFQQMFGFVLSGILLAIVMTLTFAVAEGLTRMAFPHQVRLWKIWNRPVGASTEIHTQTWIGFLSTGIFFAFSTAFYLLVTRTFNWWSPASPLYDPNILAHILPWLNPIAISLQAGFWEEALFRAIPLAGAALLGQRFGGKKWWIGGTLILQALIFGAAHASYANQPAYARVVELFIPSLAFGLLYLRFGLLPGVILHFVYDVVWISLPLFNTSASGSGLHRTLVIGLTLIPVLIILYHRFRHGKVELKDTYLNGKHIVVVPQKEKEPGLPVKTGRITPMARGFLFLLGFVCLYFWYQGMSFRKADPGLGAGRAEARAASEAALAEQGFDLSDSVWMVSERVVTPNGREGRFARQSGGETGYQQVMGTFVSGPYWDVRYARFSGDVAERAEEFRIRIVRDGRIHRFTHRLPEARPAPSLPENDAGKEAYAFVRARLGIDPETLNEISAIPQKMPNRTDWTFTWSDTVRYPLKDGEGRLSVTLSGNEVSDYNPGYIHIPEQWQRDERNRETHRNLIQNLSVVLLFFLVIIAAISGYQEMVHDTISHKLWITLAVAVFVTGMFHLWNTWPLARFGWNPAEPLQGQIFRSIAFGTIRTLIIAFCLPLLFLTIRDPESDHMRDRPSRWIGLAAGFLGLGVLTLVQNRITYYQPVWADYSALNTRIPLMAALIDRLWIYTGACIILIILFRGTDRLTGGGVRKRFQEMMAFFISGFAIAAIFQMDTLTTWFWTGLVAFIWIFWLYRVIFRSMPSAIPFTILPFFFADVYSQIRFNGYPDVVRVESIAATGLLVLAFLFSHFLRVKQGKT